MSRSQESNCTLRPNAISQMTTHSVPRNASDASSSHTDVKCEIMANEEIKNNYGATSETTLLQPKSSSDDEILLSESTQNDTSTSVCITNGSTRQSHHLHLTIPGFSRNKNEDRLSTDAESICTARSDLHKSEKYDSKRSCWWGHPKVKENWRVFFAAFGLLVVGAALIVVGIVVTALPEIGFQSYVFFIAGIICFIPGAYHVVYVYCAVKGRRGYDFYQLPLFN